MKANVGKSRKRLLLKVSTTFIVLLMVFVSGGNDATAQVIAVQSLLGQDGASQAVGTSTLTRTGSSSGSDNSSLQLNVDRGLITNSLFIHLTCWDDGFWVQTALGLPISPYSAQVIFDAGQFGTIGESLRIESTSRTNILNFSNFNLTGFVQANSGVDFTGNTTDRLYVPGLVPNTYIVDESTIFGQASGPSFGVHVISTVTPDSLNDPLLNLIRLTGGLRLTGMETILQQTGTFSAEFNVTAVPEPGIIWLFGSGLLVLLGRFRNGIAQKA